MQPYRLTIDKFLDHAAKWFGDREIVEADAGRIVARTTYAALRERSNRLSGALAFLWLARGDRLATLAWNGVHHLEVYYATMGIGAVCHTLNPRMSLDHLAQIIGEADDRVLAVSASLVPLAQELLPRCPSLRHVIVLDLPQSTATLAHGDVTVWTIDELLAEHGAHVAWGGFDEETPAGLCYTSGTTGKPKGVLYTHRSNYLHTLRALQADATALTAHDTVLLAVPMFHANGWGFPFAAPAVGAKLVLPGRITDGPSLTRLMRDEGVTSAVGVYTVWMGVLDALDRDGGDLPALERVMLGGSTVPDAFVRRMEVRLGVEVQTSWGMTELSPIGTVAPRGAPRASGGSGRPTMGLDLKLTDADGVTLPEQRGVVGRLWVKGASVIDRYFDATEDALDDDGWFETGDLAVIDEAGNLTICGRSKDLIKSGGEWINPTEIEVVVGRHPAVACAAVIGRPDEKWGERPVLIVEPRLDHELDERELLGALRGNVPDWWLPDEIARVASMPLAATGKIDKQRLRADYASGGIASRAVNR